MKKTYVLKNKRRFIILVAVFISIISSIFIFATTKTQGYAEKEYSEIVIEHGDTLWEIVTDNYGNNVNVRKMVSAIKKANEMETSEIFAGQVLLIPAE